MNQGNRDIMFWMRAKNEASGEIQRVGKDIQKIDDIAEKTRKSMALFAASIVSHRVGAGMERFGRWILDRAKEAFELSVAFDKSQRLIRTQLDMTEKQYQGMSNSVINLSRRIPLPMDQIQEGLYDIYSSMDVTTKGGIKLLEQFSQAAVAGNVDIRSSTRAAVGALNAYGKPLSEANEVLDIQFQLVRKGVGTYEEFVGILGDVYPSGVAAGQSLNDLSAALAFTTRNGLNASKAGISVARALDMLTRPQYSAAIKDTFNVDVIDEATGQFRRLPDIINDMGVALDGMTQPERKEALASVFGAGEIRANRFFNIAIGKFGELNKMTQHFASDEVAGAMTEAFDTMAGSLEFQIGLVRNNFNALTTTMARRFWPTLKTILAGLNRFVDLLARLPEPVKQFGAQVLLLGGAFAFVGGKFLQFMGNLIGAQSLLLLADQTWGSVTKTMLASARPMLFLAAKIILVVAALGLLIANWDKVSRHWRDVDSEAMDKIIALLSILAAVVIVRKVIPAVILLGQKLMWLAALAMGRLAGAMAAGAASMMALGASSLMALGAIGAIAYGIMLVVKAVQAWQFANREHAASVEASGNLAGAWLDQIKLGVRTAEENLPKIKNILNDETLSWEERNDIVHKNLKAYNDWIRAGGKTIDTNKATAETVREQIKVNEKLGHSTEWLTNKVAVFAGMSLAKFEEWRAGTVENFNLVKAKMGDLANKQKLSAGDIIGSLRKAMRGQVEFGKNWTDVAKRAGKDADGLLKYLQENFGAQAPAIVEALAAATDKEFTSIVKLFNNAQKHADRMSQAVGKDFDHVKSKAGIAEDAIRKFGGALRSLPNNYTLDITINGVDQLNRVKATGGRVIEMQHGGYITEPIFGVGRSGQRYSFGENGVQEKVTPVGSGAGEVHAHFHTYGRPDDEFVRSSMNELDWIRRTRGW